MKTTVLYASLLPLLARAGPLVARQVGETHGIDHFMGKLLALMNGPPAWALYSTLHDIWTDFDVGPTRECFRGPTQRTSWSTTGLLRAALELTLMMVRLKEQDWRPGNPGRARRSRQAEEEASVQAGQAVVGAEDQQPMPPPADSTSSGRARPAKKKSGVELTLRSLEEQFKGTMRLSHENDKGVKDLGLSALVDDPRTLSIMNQHLAMNTFVFELFSKERIVGLGNKVRAIYKDSRFDYQPVPYNIANNPPPGEPALLTELIDWGLRLNVSPLSVVFKVALELDNEASFCDFYEFQYEETQTEGSELFNYFGKAKGLGMGTEAGGNCWAYVQCGDDKRDYNNWNVCYVGGNQHFTDDRIGDFSVKFTEDNNGLVGPVIALKDVGPWAPLVVETTMIEGDVKVTDGKLCRKGLEGGADDSSLHGKKIAWACGVPKAGASADGQQSDLGNDASPLKGGRCGIHVTQHQVPKGPNNHYSLEVQIKDNDGNVIGHLDKTDSDNSVGVDSKLPLVMVVSTVPLGSVDNTDAQPVQFRYGADAWDSNNNQRCSSGGYDQDKREMDCGFSC